MPFREDKDYLDLDTCVALADDIIEAANTIKDKSDDPMVVLKALHNESAALVIKGVVSRLKGRFIQLKKMERKRPTAANSGSGSKIVE